MGTCRSLALVVGAVGMIVGGAACSSEVKSRAVGNTEPAESSAGRDAEKSGSTDAAGSSGATTTTLSPAEREKQEALKAAQTELARQQDRYANDLEPNLTFSRGVWRISNGVLNDAIESANQLPEHKGSQDWPAIKKDIIDRALVLLEESRRAIGPAGPDGTYDDNAGLLGVVPAGFAGQVTAVQGALAQENAAAAQTGLTAMTKSLDELQSVVFVEGAPVPTTIASTATKPVGDMNVSELAAYSEQKLQASRTKKSSSEAGTGG